MNKKSPYSNAYKIGLSVFIVLVVLISTIIISVIKSCEPKVSRFFNQKTNMTDTIFYDGPDTDIQAMIQKIQKSISMVGSPLKRSILRNSHRVLLMRMFQCRGTSNCSLAH